MTDEPMHDHQLDLIMSLAAGALDDTARAAAEIQIAACDECVTELAAQRLALDALHAAPAPQLSELEAARMRRALHDELGLIDPAPAKPAERRWSLRWQRLSVGLSAAAVLLLVVAVVPALELFGAGDNDAADFTAAPAAAELSPEEAADGGAGDDVTIAVSESAGLPVTTTVTDRATMASGGAQTQSFVAFGPSPDLEEIAAASLRGYLEVGNAAILLGYEGGDLDVTAVDERVQLCVAADTFGPNVEAVPLGSAIVDGSDALLVAYVSPETAGIVIVAHAASDCGVLDSTS